MTAKLIAIIIIIMHRYIHTFCKAPKNRGMNLKHWHRVTRWQKQIKRDEILVDV